VPVFGGQLVAHLALAGTLTSVSGRYHRGLTATVAPRVTAATVVARARSGLGGALAEVAVDQRPAAATRLPPVRRRLLVMACTGGSGVVDAGWM
jgi:hypothetical protein